MMKYDAVLFDLDGTLTRSEPGITNCVQYALEKMGCAPMPLEQRQKFIGPPLFESFRDLAGMHDEDAARAVEAYRERFSTVGWQENSVYEGIPDVLRALKRQGVYLAVASAKPLKFVRQILDLFCLTKLFDRVEAIQLTDHHADKAEIVRRALPASCKHAAMVGDRRFDMEGAKQMGVAAIGVSYGYGSREELMQAGADAVCDTVDELAEALGCESWKKGMFLTFEGTDGCGKTTQMRNTIEFLRQRGYEVHASREPGGCPISEKIRQIILDKENAEMTPVCEAYLYAAARAQHVGEVIRPALAAGKIVVCDRYLDSSMVYQGIGRDLGMDAVAELNRFATGGLQSDLTLLFDMSPEAALARRGEGEKDRLELAPDDFRHRVRAGYQALAEASQGRIVVVDAAQTQEEVWASVRAILEHWLDGRS